MRRFIIIYENMLCHSHVFFIESSIFHVVTQLAALCSKKFYLKNEGAIHVNCSKTYLNLRRVEAMWERDKQEEKRRSGI